jgi:Holliday junction resolvase RusA-like endonuclease
MTLIRFTIPGPAIGKGRPRFSRKSGAAFTPAKTRNHEAFVKMLAVEAMKVGGKPSGVTTPPFDTPCALIVQIFCTIPPSWNKARREAAKGNIIRPGKPDIDNVIKSIGDAMNGVVYTDDNLIYRVEATKMFADTACTTVEVHA